MIKIVRVYPDSKFKNNKVFGANLCRCERKEKEKTRVFINPRLCLEEYTL